MRRLLYLTLATPLLFLLFILPYLSGGWNEHMRLAVEIGGATLLGILVFFRFSSIGARRELSVLPSLPFLSAPAYHILTSGGMIKDSGIVFLLLLGVFFIGAGIAMIMSYVPDKCEPGSRRMDGVSIVLSVFTAYFVLTELISLIRLAL